MKTTTDQDISYEVQKDIADRYFGFRRLIEQDIKDYGDKVLASSARLEQKIGFEMIRLYILLKDQQLIKEFFELAGLEQMIFYDPYLTESETIKKRVFKGQLTRGLTKKGRFFNMVFDTYHSLTEHIESYRRTLEELVEKREAIADEIKAFYEKNDLTTIMGFMRSLSDSNLYKAGSMEGGLNPLTGEQLDQKMKLQPPQHVEDLLPIIPRLPPLSDIKKQLKNIVNRAWRLQDGLDVRDLVGS
ncbi:MAG: hypothetical protein ACLFV2_10200 [Desulfurivibrionaceae bacterium]